MICPLRIMTIVGARPQFIKAAMLSKALSDNDSCQEILVHTGQHYDPEMSEVFFEEMAIPKPDFNLEVGSCSHGAQTGRMLEQLEKVMLEVKPDWVLVYGDTNSTLAGALAASKLHLPVAHVEAGLRSFNKKMPEEINRILVDQLSTLLFTPTSKAREHLLNEGFSANAICQVGDIMLDAVKFFSSADLLTKIETPLKPYALVTIHRAENTDSKIRLQNIVHSLEEISSEMEVVWPIHPRTESYLSRHGMETNLKTIRPVGYLEMLALMKNAEVIITDSGGVQKEAFFSETPCVTCRNETEWVELLESGWNRLANPDDRDAIPKSVRSALSPHANLVVESFYGDGNAASKIIDSLLNFK